MGHIPELGSVPDSNFGKSNRECGPIPGISHHWLSFAAFRVLRKSQSAWRYSRAEQRCRGVEAVSRRVAAGRAGHVGNEVLAKVLIASEVIRECGRQRRHRTEDDVFRRSGADLSILEKVHVSGLTVFQAGRNAGDEGVAVDEFSAGAEGPVLRRGRLRSSA